uniref:Uncharacterized protein n=1 Tax=Clandestinovirus TaxID=2831644 RepID=A0A8F8PMC7_9VIRU|nr:hypothetical protein KOM_12_140 [Clandestinovirus]
MSTYTCLVKKLRSSDEFCIHHYERDYPLINHCWPLKSAFCSAYLGKQTLHYDYTMSNPAITDEQYVAMLQREYHLKQEFLFLHSQLKTDAWMHGKTIRRNADAAIDDLLGKLNPLRSQLGFAPIRLHGLTIGVRFQKPESQSDDEDSSDSDSW